MQQNYVFFFISTKHKTENLSCKYSQSTVILRVKPPTHRVIIGICHLRESVPSIRRRHIRDSYSYYITSSYTSISVHY